jgi:DNA-binding response OmpR family regulator
VLVADDDALVRIVLRAALERSGFRVLTAENGAGALTIAEDQHPDVVILDARMPGLTHEQVMARLQPLPDSGPPVLVLSGQLTLPAEPNRHRVGALSKPVELDTLLAELDRLLSTP